MREAWRSLEESCHPGFDLVFVARPGIRGRGMAAVAAEMKRLLRTLGVIR
jgi:putative membrane protein insertion efficiency factor